MRSLRRIEISLMEDVRMDSGFVQQQYVPHNFSANQAIYIIAEMIRSLSSLLSTDEMKDLRINLLRELDELGSVQGIGPVEPLKIHGV